MEAESIVDCPWCEGEQMLIEASIGILGALAHFKCKHCGGEFSRTAPTEEQDDELEHKPSAQENA